MTVTFDVGIPQRFWRGYTDPGLPVGMYRSVASVVGDMSGGNMIIIFVFKPEGSPISGRFYNIEQIELMATGAVANGFLQTNNWDNAGPTGLLNFTRPLRVLADGGTFGTSLDRFQGPKFPLFLGSPSASQDLEGAIHVGFPNVIAKTVACMIEGYIWESRSILAEGGLRRPVDGLYG